MHIFDHTVVLCGAIPTIPHMTLRQAVRDLEDELDMSHSEEVEETGRTVARLRD